MHLFEYTASDPALVDPLGRDPGVRPATFEELAFAQEYGRWSGNPRNNPRKGCGITVRQNDVGNLPDGSWNYGHRWIVIDDPGSPPSEDPALRGRHDNTLRTYNNRPAGIRGVGRYPQGVMSQFGDRPPDCAECDSDDPAVNASPSEPGHTEWDTTIDPLASYARVEWVSTPNTHGGPVTVYQPSQLQWGGGSGTPNGLATCEQIRDCIYSFRARDALGYTFIDLPPYGSNCRSDVGRILAGCGLKMVNGRRTAAGQALDAYQMMLGDSKPLGRRD
jgi:hypothetical protein